MVDTADGTVLAGLTQEGTWMYRQEFAQKVLEIRRDFLAEQAPPPEPVAAKKNAAEPKVDFAEEQAEEEDLEVFHSNLECLDVGFRCQCRVERTDKPILKPLNFSTLSPQNHSTST